MKNLLKILGLTTLLTFLPVKNSKAQNEKIGLGIGARINTGVYCYEKREYYYGRKNSIEVNINKTINPQTLVQTSLNYDFGKNKKLNSTQMDLMIYFTPNKFYNNKNAFYIGGGMGYLNSKEQIPKNNFNLETLTGNFTIGIRVPLLKIFEIDIGTKIIIPYIHQEEYKNSLGSAEIKAGLDIVF